MTSDFEFAGGLGGSKSLFIRALIAASYAPELLINGTSDSDDVERVRLGLAALEAGREIDCGDGGAVLRFLAVRASRVPGEHALVGSERLFSRPIVELTDVLTSLGATAEVSGSRLVVRSPGWQAGELVVDCSRSSQFATAVLINSWGLDAPITIGLSGLSVSAGYWEMTKVLVGALGMETTDGGAAITVGARQQVTASAYDVEIDMGSAFAVAALAAVGGRARIEDWPETSLQPDSRFPDVLDQMGASVAVTDSDLVVSRAAQLAGIEVDLGNSPDLFPVLSALAGLAKGPSVLAGAPQLRFKESDRVAKAAELLEGMGRRVVPRPDGIEVSGELGSAEFEFEFDADQDHRMAMAAAVAKQGGVPVRLSGADAVAKSFAGFWDIAGWRP